MRTRTCLVAAVSVILLLLTGAAPAAAQPAVPGQPFPAPGDLLDDAFGNLLAASDIDSDILNSSNLCASSIALATAALPESLIDVPTGEEVCFRVDPLAEDD